MSTDLVHRQTGALAQIPEGARALGQRVKPIIRLGMGVKDAERGFPKKTDYFTVRGDEKAVAKFTEVYGKPKAVRIMVPAELGLALDISYRSFIGGGEDGDGRPLALGLTNFATLGYVGGPDVLRVWKQDGSYAEVETAGLDELGQPLDEIAKDLNIEVHATFTFTIPDVLGWGSFCQVTSKGKKSADNLAYKLTQIYSAFGSKAPFAFNPEEPPLLVLKPDTAMVRFEKDGVAKWGKVDIFALDIVIPEAFDKMVDRLRERQEQIAPVGAAAALYPPREIGAAPEVPPPAGEENGTEQAAGEVVQEGPSTEAKPTAQVASETDGTPAPAHAEGTWQIASSFGVDGYEVITPDGETISGYESHADAEAAIAGFIAEAQNEPIEEAQFTVPDGVGTNADVQAANEAAEALVPFGKHKGITLAELVALGDEGLGRIKWALKQWKTEPFRAQVFAFAKVYAPDEYEAAVAESKTEAEVA